MLKLKHITKDYVTKQQTIHVLKDLTLNFRECEFVTILGQSGCGKTTLLNIIGGLDRYTSGDIFINEKSTKDFDDRDWDKYRNKQIGFVFQSYNLIPHLNVLRNVELALTLAGKKTAEREAAAMEALKKVGLEDQAYKKPNQLSGGQMQRVAIARALVNNPAIILADEPTGALDSDSGTMVMGLLKEVARDRLVILVSHNAELAKEYSTRTVKLADGRIVDDDNPLLEEGDEEPFVETFEPTMKKNIRQRIKKSYKQIVHERKEERKVSMDGGTTIGLSARNLYSKKWRTFLTSFAGSIGIIGIALVLALSAGVNTYLRSTEESALSIYPLEITEKGASIEELASMLMSTSQGEKFPATSNVFINKVAGNIIGDTSNLGDALGGMFFNNDLTAIKAYLDDNLSDQDGYVQYSYSSGINIYRHIPLSDGTYAADNYTKISPFTDSIDGMTSAIPGVDIAGIISENFGSYLGMFERGVFSELISNQKLLEQQYDVLAGEWANQEGYAELDANGNPTGYTVYDCVLQVDRYNKIADYMLFAIGLMHPNEVTGMLLDSGDENSFFNKSFTAEELMAVEYYVLSDTDYYTESGDTYINEYLEDENGEYTLKTKDTADFIESRVNAKNADGTAAGGIKLKISGIVRAKENASSTGISGLIAYPHTLVEAVVARCQNSAVVDAQRRNCYYNGEKVLLDEHYQIADGTDEDDVRYVAFAAEGVSESDKTRFAFKDIDNFVTDNMGYAQLETPKSIAIYAASFDGKENILKLFSDYESNAEYNPEGNKIKYTDMWSTLMGYVKQLTNAMITALIAFSAISLIVSSIMISIITYTSVLERRKEIGVLRSIGARKMDVSNLFISESSIIGVISGLLGISFGYLFTFIANVIIEKIMQIPNLLHLNWYYALALVVISFLLALIAGIIPASIAANKDPVEALRAE